MCIRDRSNGSQTMNNDKITKKQEQQLIEMLEIMEDTVEYFCDQNTVSGETAWNMVASLAEVKLGQFND